MLVCRYLIHNGEDALYHLVKSSLVELTLAYSVIKIAVALTVSALTRHLKITSCLERLYSSENGIPVTHNKAVKAPFITQNTLTSI